MWTAPPAVKSKSRFLYAIHEGLQLPAAAGMTQLAECLGFDLANAFPGDLEALPDLFERVLRAVLQAEPHLDDAFFPRSQRGEHLRRVLLQID